MCDKSHIISKEDINRFLKDKSNNDILERHHKLWLTSSNVLSLYLNKYIHSVSKVELEKAKEERKYFVDTKPYRDAINLIDNNNILLITGDPGVGKSITSRMIILYLLAKCENYEFVTTPTNNISKLIEAMNDDKKEIIFLDDFLGQTCDNISLQYLKELDVLIRIIKNNPNKKLLMNSRVTIYNKVIRENDEISKILSDINLIKYTIDIGKITFLDRARILYNFLYMNKIPYKEFLIIKNGYNSIIYHKSYSTRIIEYSIRKYKQDSNDHLSDIIIYNLDHPSDVWKSEFERIEKIDRLVMYQIYSLGDGYIPFKTVRECLDNYLLKYDKNLENTNFNASIYRLNKSMVAINVFGESKYIKVINPSINDYIQDVFCNETILQKRILESTNYIEQISKLVSLNPDNLSYEFDFSSMKFYCDPNNNSEHILSIKLLNFIYSYDYENVNCIDLVNNIFSINIHNSIQISFLLNTKLRNFYSLDHIINDINRCSDLFNDATYDQFVSLFKYYSNLFNFNESLEPYNESVVSAIENFLIDSCNDYLEIFLNDMDPKDKYYLSEDNLELLVLDDLDYKIDEALFAYLKKELNNIAEELHNYNYNLDLACFKYSNIFSCLNINNIIDIDCYCCRRAFNIKNDDVDLENSFTTDDVFKQDYNTEW